MKVDRVQNQLGRRKPYESFFEMQHNQQKAGNPVVPFDKDFINVMEKEGYKISEDFESWRKKEMTPEVKLARLYDAAKRGSENPLIQEKSRQHHKGYAKGILAVLNILEITVNGINSTNDGGMR
ncbi:hypothetical protein [Rummeliibacillus stabekisii]|uniref:Uncharacterized protein n=1 Tax=Rummeliibacillus stabekisii TaxID=241244 RepID=A0A143HC34_9BACL|nr:hypothetical protein [Rummeliibacillus stabekisii]AMW99327.1 hypothetical protein ATY39_07530 [Rummeliibacillus stabekisii]